ncbi:unnamed protein product, partial [Sphagnum balticum]
MTTSREPPSSSSSSAFFLRFIFWSSVFCNTTSATSFATPLQHHFCSIASTCLFFLWVVLKKVREKKEIDPTSMP